MELTETHILALKDGEFSGYNAVFHAFYKNIVTFSERLVDNLQDAEEIAQDTFEKFWKHRQKFDSAEYIKSWLHLTAKNACYNLLKAKARQSKRDYELKHFHQKFNEDNILRTMVHSELLKEINEEIEQLSPACRDVFKLLYYEEMTPAEVALKLNITVGTVYNHKMQAVNKLRKAPFYKSFLFTLLILVYVYLNK